MGIFGAMTTAISGLQAQSFALENVSGNIANSRTTGFKRVDTAFADLVPDLPTNRSLSGSVGAYSHNTATVSGDVQASQIGTNAALSGEGFFIVSKPTGYANGQPIFGGNPVYTRRGDFEMDRNGYLVNGSGYTLMGQTLDPVTGAVTSTVQPFQISKNTLAPSATTTIDYRANLPSYPKTKNADPLIAGSELLSGALYTGATVAATDDQGFQDRTVVGNSFPIFDAAGTTKDVQLRWGKTSNATPATWSLYYLSDNNASGAAPKWTQISNNIQFNASGQLITPASGQLTQAFTVDGVTFPSMNLNFGTTGLTQYSNTASGTQGSVVVISKTQDGYGAGFFMDGSQSISDQGTITATYSNGKIIALGQVPIAQFSAANLLKRQDGGVFEETADSGQPIVNGGTGVVGSSLEASNVDIADEFSKMIVTQQAYSANTKVLTTAQTMLQDVINIIR
jgi:flagellar hook protein FlgE